jgi:His-Xaa-Ser system protein HxsD
MNIKKTSQAYEINKDENSVIVKINPVLYNINIVYSAAYVFLDKAYILLDGDPNTQVIVKITPKQNEDLERLGKEFMNELIKFGFYKYQNTETMTLRSLILKRVLMLDENRAPIYALESVKKSADELIDIVYPAEENVRKQEDKKESKAVKAETKK